MGSDVSALKKFLNVLSDIQSHSDTDYIFTLSLPESLTSFKDENSILNILNILNNEGFVLAMTLEDYHKSRFAKAYGGKIWIDVETKTMPSNTKEYIDLISNAVEAGTAYIGFKIEPLYGGINIQSFNRKGLFYRLPLAGDAFNRYGKEAADAIKGLMKVRNKMALNRIFEKSYEYGLNKSFKDTDIYQVTNFAPLFDVVKELDAEKRKYRLNPDDMKMNVGLFDTAKQALTAADIFEESWPGWTYLETLQTKAWMPGSKEYIKSLYELAGFMKGTAEAAALRKTGRERLIFVSENEGKIYRSLVLMALASNADETMLTHSSEVLPGNVKEKLISKYGIEFADSIIQTITSKKYTLTDEQLKTLGENFASSNDYFDKALYISVLDAKRVGRHGFFEDIIKFFQHDKENTILKTEILSEIKIMFKDVTSNAELPETFSDTDTNAWALSEILRVFDLNSDNRMPSMIPNAVSGAQSVIFSRNVLGSA